jgi:transcription elongation factor Elf1
MVPKMKKPEKKCEHTIKAMCIESDGSFNCPQCGMSISPDDVNDDNYQIMDTKVVNDELAELVIACGKCGCIIKLTGFQQGFDA